jgi:hypothetical protein
MIKEGPREEKPVEICVPPAAQETSRAYSLHQKIVAICIKLIKNEIDSDICH